MENEFRRYLECGLHAHGFARAVCEACGDELLLPFSCKRRGICPACNTRRMSNTAAHLMDCVISRSETTAAAQRTPPRSCSRPRAPSAAATPPAEVVLPSSLDSSDARRFVRLSQLAWAILYQRVFDIDPLECSSCGGRMRFVEVIEEVDRARSELRRRHPPAEPPPLARARAPDWDD